MTNYTLDQQFLEKCIESGTQAYREEHSCLRQEVIIMESQQCQTVHQCCENLQNLLRCIRPLEPRRSFSLH